jgi:hypothetical protein
MPHTRIRKFNTKDTCPEQQLDNDLCQAVIARSQRDAGAAGGRFHCRYVPYRHRTG